VLIPFHMICTPIHTSRKDESRIKTVIPKHSRQAICEGVTEEDADSDQGGRDQSCQDNQDVDSVAVRRICA
jgi:hypothetical protein